MNPICLPQHRDRLRSQQGFMLLEVLVALLIFALGVLGLVGLQANAVKQVGDAKYRTDAAMLADDLVGQMQVSARDSASLSAAFNSTNGTAYPAWKARVVAALPGAGNTGNAPTVTLTPIAPLPALLGAVASGPTAGTVVTGTATTLTNSTQVTITLFWQSPSEPTADGPHKLTVVTQIK